MNKSVTYQDQLLNTARKENAPVTVFLMNGFQIRGVIKAFDQYVILVESEGKQQMIYKHAVSTVIFSKNYKLETNCGDE